MEKIKIEKEYVFKVGDKPITWGELKRICPAKDDWEIYDNIEFSYTEEETDEEYARRIILEKLRNKLKEKAEYRRYLELKEKYENDNARND